MKAKGERQQKGGDRGNQYKPAKRHEDALALPKLSELGMTTKDASNWQLLAEARSVAAQTAGRGRKKPDSSSQKVDQSKREEQARDKAATENQSVTRTL